MLVMPTLPIRIFHPLLIEEFWSRVLKTDYCWFWTRALDIDGYGDFCGVPTHRLAWHLTNGPIPTDLVICHRCNNPPCVNPAHLFPDTNENNQRHRFSQGRVLVAPRDWSWLRQPKKVLSPEFRFTMRVVVQANGCWLWTGGVSAETGYGIFHFKKGWIMSAHRASWILHHQAVPEGLKVLHKCDNRRCVSPTHLWVGTQKENMHDMHSKGRARKAVGEQAGKAKLTAPQVLEMRRLHTEEGWGCTRLGRLFGVTEQSVMAIIRRQSWRHI